MPVTGFVLITGILFNRKVNRNIFRAIATF